LGLGPVKKSLGYAPGSIVVAASALGLPSSAQTNTITEINHCVPVNLLIIVDSFASMVVGRPA
jgi:hypothetical protein